MNQYTPHQILVTGGAGFIGCNFIRHLQTCLPETFIITLDALTYAGSLNNLEDLPNPDKHFFQKGDIRNIWPIKDLIKEYNIDTIVHFAAESHVDRSLAEPDTFVYTNLVGTFNLLEAAREFWLEQQQWDETKCRFHHISTDEVYGSLTKEAPAFTEQTPFAPNSPYSATKAGSDHLVRAYHHSYGLPTTISNCSNNYGPYQHDEKLIPTIIRQCLKQQSIPLYGDGSNIRDWLYVEDHCDAIRTIITEGKNGDTYNVGGCNEWSNLSIARYICQQLDRLRPRAQPYEKLIRFITDRPGHDWRYAIDISKIKNELHWRPKETFESGIEKTLQFYLQRLES